MYKYTYVYIYIYIHARAFRVNPRSSSRSIDIIGISYIVCIYIYITAIGGGSMLSVFVDGCHSCIPQASDLELIYIQTYIYTDIYI